MESYWDDVIAYLRTAPTVKAWLDHDDETRSIREITDEDLLDWINALQYKGFNILNILTLVKKSYDDYMNSARGDEIIFTVKYSTGGVSKSFGYSNKQKLSRDIHMMITLFMVRGNNLDKIKEKSMGNMSDLISCLVEKLSIDVEHHNPTTSLEPNLITMPRLCACFPIIACEIQERMVAKSVCTPSDLGLTGDISAVIFTPFFTSCIPKESIVIGNENMHLLFFVVHIVVDDTLHRKKRDFTDLQSMLQYYQAAYDSPAVPHKSRLAYCRAKGLIIAGGKKFVNTLQIAQTNAIDMIKTLRPDDKYSASVIDNLKKLK